jgi:hypothetical protein
MKYKMEWLLCLGVFGAGVVWAELIFPSDFWKVDNVHDLFEILGAVATSGAVIIALMTMNAWKRQAKAEADHELARRVVIFLRGYRDELVHTWSYAESSVAQIRGNTWIGEGGNDNPMIEVYQGRLDQMQVARAQLAPIELECAEIWGGLFTTKFAELYSYEDGFRSFIEIYLRLLIRGTFDDRSDMESDDAVRRWALLNQWGLGDRSSAEATIDGLIEPLKSGAKKRLIGFGE